MPGAFLFTEHLPVDPLSVVPYPQPKQAFVVVDLYFNAARVRMLERIAQSLPCKLMNFVTNNLISSSVNGLIV
jgi:hypothetical protein